MRRSRVAPLCAVAALGVGGGVHASAAPASSTRGIVFYSLRVAPDYASSHLVVATGSQLGCQSGCSRLLLSHDGGATWTQAAAGWNGGDAQPAVTPRGAVLVSATPSSLQESWDGGAHFTTEPVPGGALDVWSESGRDARAIVVDSSDHWHQLSVAGLAGQDVPGAGGSLQYGSGIWVAPDATGATTAGLAAGKSTASGHPAVARCTAGWRCDAPSDVAPVSDSMLVRASPAFAQDHAVFARSLQSGTLYRSLDSGRSFTPETVASPASGQVVATLQGLAFSADFVAAPAQGSAYAAVTGVAQAIGAQPGTVGGVYLSRDGGVAWRHLGQPSELDNGATAVVATPDGHVLAGYVDSQAHSAGLLCTADGSTWAAACPASGSSGGRAAEQSRQATAGGSGGLASGGATGAPAVPAGAATSTSAADSAGPAAAGAVAGGGGRSGGGGAGGVAVVVAVALAAGAAGGYAWWRRRAAATPGSSAGG